MPDRDPTAAKCKKVEKRYKKNTQKRGFIEWKIREKNLYLFIHTSRNFKHFIHAYEYIVNTLQA
jgi:hypothetical protein